MAAESEPVALAAITVSELLAGIYRAIPSRRRGQREAFVEVVLAGTPVLPFDREAARRHPLLAAELHSSGNVIGANDALIAATALAHGFAVMTYNRRDFDRVPGLTVLAPNW